MILLQRVSAHTAERNLGSDFMTEIYTLPTCPICEMVKTKLKAKEIPFVERPFEELPGNLEVDRAPVLAVDDGTRPGCPIYILTPMAINQWIEAI